MELLKFILKAVISVAGFIFLGCNIFSLIDVGKIIDEERKILVKESHEFVRSFVIRSLSFFGFGDTTLPAVKPFVRDAPHQKYIVIREKELKELKELFDGFPNHDNTVNGVYLFGVPGSGKTEIARQYGNFAYKKHGVSTVITLNAEKLEDFRQDLVEALIEIEKSKLTIDQIDSLGRWSNDPQISMSFLMNTKLRQSLQKRPGWLLIVDNIRDPNIAQNELYKELPRPGTDKWGTGTMLVTTQVPLHHRNSTHIRIKNTNDGLTLDDATNFLCGLVTRNDSSRVCDKKVATEIVIKLERLPLSIFAAGIYVESSMSMKSDGSYSIDNYLEELKSLGITHGQNLTPSQSDYRHSMLAALQLTIDQTIKVNSEELPADVFLDFIALIGYTAGEAEGTISSLYVEKYIEIRGRDRPAKHFLTLRNFPLVDFWEEKKRFWAHQVVRYAFRAALERRGMDLLLYTFGNISHYVATVYKSSPYNRYHEIHDIFWHFVENLPSPYCHQKLCLIPSEKNPEDLISLFFNSLTHDKYLRSLQFGCVILDTFFIRLCNIRRDNPNNSVRPLMMLKGYQYLHYCYKGQHEKQSMVATRAIDIIKEVAPEHSELHTIAASTFILKEIRQYIGKKDEVFRSLLCSKTTTDMYFRVRDIRRVVDYFQKLCSSLSEFYKELIPLYREWSSRLETMRRTTLISISKMASVEVFIESVATMSRCFIFYYDDKVIRDKKLPNERHIGLGRRYQFGQYEIKQSYVGELNLYGACSSKQVYTVKDFGTSLIFYIDYDIRIGLKNTEIVFDKYFDVFNYFIPMLRKFKTILHRLIFTQENREREKMICQFTAFSIMEEIHQGPQRFSSTHLSVKKLKSPFRDKILLFSDHLLCVSSVSIDDKLFVGLGTIYRNNFPVYYMGLVPHEDINSYTIMDRIRRYVYFDAMAFSLRELLCYQRPEEATEIVLEIFDAIMYALSPTTELMPDLEL